MIIYRMRCIMRILLVIISCISFGICVNSTFAQSYQDDFDVLDENDWVLWGHESDWKVEEGFLRATIQTPFMISVELLQFKGFPPPYKIHDLPFGSGPIKNIQRQIKQPGHANFTITVKNIGSHKASFGIALGKVFPEFPGVQPFFYLFFTDRIEAARFAGWGGLSSSIFWREGHHPDTNWKTFELESMVIHFNEGHFQWFVDSEKRADFIDSEFSPIEIIGFVVAGYDEFLVCQGWVDSFKISGPNLSVSPQVKLATTWGQIKQK